MKVNTTITQSVGDQKTFTWSEFAKIFTERYFDKNEASSCSDRLERKLEKSQKDRKVFLLCSAYLDREQVKILIEKLREIGQ